MKYYVLLYVILFVDSCDVNGATFCRLTTEDGSLRFSSQCDVPSKETAKETTSLEGKETAKETSSLEGNWKLYVDDVKPRQDIIGFGAAWTDATVTVFDTLNETMRRDVMRELFDHSNSNVSLGLNLMRHTIGQSDLTPPSIGQWSYDNTTEPDTNLTHFCLQPQGERMVSYLKQMREIATRNVTLFGSPWSPPQWMKQDNKISEDFKSSWVDYMIKYLEMFQKMGVTVDAMTPQNEPLHSADTSWTMYMDANTQVELVNRLSSQISNRGLSTKIWGYDHNTDNLDYPQRVLDSCENVSTIAWHCYAFGLTQHEIWDPLERFTARNPNSTSIMTECWTHDVETSENFFHLPTFVGYPLQSGASGALAWTLGGSTKYDVAFQDGCHQCSGLVQIDPDSGDVIKTQDFFTMAHFSKFVQDSRYLDTTGTYDYLDGTGVMANAFLNSKTGERVVVIQNRIRSALNISVIFTSGEVWSANVPARSIVTWVG